MLNLKIKYKKQFKFKKSEIIFVEVVPGGQGGKDRVFNWFVFKKGAGGKLGGNLGGQLGDLIVDFQNFK